MKKYLMTGIAALAMCAGFTSCSHDEGEEYTPEKAQAMKDKAEYDAAFLAYVGGHISPEQTWGFNKVTRGFTRGHNANANEWGRTWVVPETLTVAQKERVRLYFQYNKQPDGISINYTNFFVQDVYKGATNPLNDGENPEMAQYSTEVYSFGNELVAGSAHMDKLTAGSDNDHINNYNNAHCSTNDNVWDGITYEPGYPLTAETAAAQGIGDWQAENYNHVVYHSDQIMLMVDSKTDCFGWNETMGSVQQNENFVIISGATIDEWAALNGNPGASVAGRYFVGFDYDAQYVMSDLYAFPDGWDEWVYNPETNQTEQIHHDEVRSNEDGIPYLKNNLNQFAHRIVEAGTEGAYPVWERDYWVIPGCADGYYSDWIICVTPGVLKEVVPPMDEAIRIIAEDLSAREAGDFDFNDVVLDVIFDNYNATLILQAAGGTLPLYIDDNEAWEVHKLFKVDTDYMVNTNAKKLNLKGNYRDAEPVTFQLGRPIRNAEEANDIKLVIFKNGVKQTLTAEKGEPAAKLAVGLDYNWLDERASIKEEYELFVTWADAEPFMSKWW